MNNGWVKLYRGLIEKAFYSSDSERVHLWIHLLLKANHSGKEEMFGGKPIRCKPGQFTTGRKQLAEETGINESKIERTLTYFEKSEQQIEQRKSNGNRLITILNWDEFQSSEQQSEQRVNNERTTSEQRVNTLQECKEGEECKEDVLLDWRKDFQVYLSQVTEAYQDLLNNVEYIQERERYHKNLDIRLSLEKSFNDFWGTEAGWKNKKKSRSVYLDWERTFNNSLSQKMNQVYKSRNDLFSQPPSVTTTPDNRPRDREGNLIQ